MSTDRRRFLKGLMGVGAGTAVAGLPGCAPDIEPAPVADVEKDPDGRVRLEVARYPQLAEEGGALTLRVPGEQQMLVMHPSGNQYAVTASHCTHRGCPLGFQSGVAVCPCHGARFEVSGQVLHPPATVALATYVSAYDARTGVLLIDLRAGDSGFPALMNGKVVFPFDAFPVLRTPGGVVSGKPPGYGKRLFVFALEGGGYSAVDAICTHQGCEVAYNTTLGEMVCPCHDSRFSKEGAVLTPPATKGLKTFTVTREDTAVTVLIPG